MKRVLFVTYDFPFPTNTGGKNRAYHMLKYSKGDFKKYLFSFVRPDFREEYKKEIEKIGVEVIGTEIRTKVRSPRNILGLFSGKSIFKTIYFSREISADLLRIITDLKVDMVHFESFYTAFYISDVVRKLGVKQIYGSENIEFKLYEDYTRGKLLKPLLDIQVNKIKNEEIAMYLEADLTLAVTEDEVKFVKKYAEKCIQIPNGIDVDEFRFQKPVNKKAANLLFVGNFTYFPNVEAINSFYDEVFKFFPENIRLTVVGKKVSELKFASDPRVEAIEFIPDIKDAYRAADVLISPIRTGGGTNFKILEAMASGVPVIAFGDRADALDAEDGKQVLVAKNSADFKNKIEELLSDLELRQKLTENARKLVEEKYSWENIGKELSRAWESV